MKLGKYSIGIGDRFGHQAIAQLKAIMKANELGIDLTPVWNKSFREHEIINSHPKDTRKKADEAVLKLGWNADYFVDADHININSIDMFIDSCDFFTIDIADFIGKSANQHDINDFIVSNTRFKGEFKPTGISRSFVITEVEIRSIAEKYLYAVKEAGRIYEYLAKSKIEKNFIVEISIDETNEPQTPLELFFILSAISEEGIPVQTIAPKFSGRFNKGVDYVGDVEKFRREFEEDIAIIKFAIKEFSLPHNLKLSVHSGSDKFSIYPAIKSISKKFNTGFHLKTAGTSWLEELIGLALAGNEGLQLTKEIYHNAYYRFEELRSPYANVIDIDTNQLPKPEDVNKWSGEKYASTLRHEQECSDYNPDFRQLLHVAYKIAAEMGKDYLDALEEYKDIISENIIENLYHRHIKRLFI